MLRYALFILLSLLLSGSPARAQLAPITVETVNNVRATQWLGTGRPSSGMFSPDGKLLGLVGSFGVQVYELAAPDIPDTLGGEIYPGYGLAFSPDSRQMVVTGGYGIRIYDLEGGADRIAMYPDSNGPLSVVAYRPDGTQFAVGAFSSTGRIIIFDTATLQVLHTLDSFTDAVTTLEYSADGTLLAAGSRDNSVTLFETGGYTIMTKLAAHTNPVTDVAFDVSGSILYTSGFDGLIQSYSLPDGTFLKTVYTALGEVPHAIGSLAAHPNGSLYFSEAVASADILTLTGVVNVLDLANGQSAPFIATAHSTPITALDLSPDQSTLLSVSADFANLSAIPSQSGFGLPFMADAYSVTVTPDGSGIAIGGSLDLGSLFGSDGTLFANIQTDEAPIRTLAYNASGGALVAGTDAAKVYVFSGDGSRLSVLEDVPGALTAAQFSPDESLVALGFSDGTLRLYNTSDLSLSAEMTPHSNALESLDFSPDGSQLITASLDSTVLLWEVPSLTRLGNFVGHSAGVASVEFSPDGTRAVTSGYDAAYVWDIATQAQLFDLPEHYGTITSAHYSPDATLILTTSEDGSERLYDALTGEQLRVFYDHNAPVYDGAWLPDGAGFVTVGGDGFGIVFEVVR